MSLALMPGSEPIAVQVPEPEVAQPVGNPWQSGGRLSADGGAIHGCDCMSCVQLRRSYRELEQRRAVMAAQYGSQVVDEASEYPRGMPPGMIRGRYDMSQYNRNDGFHGQVRWRMPGTSEVYDSDGRRQWTYEEELPDGTLVDRQNRRWVPDSARQDIYAEIATAMPVAATPVFNWGDIPPPELRRSPS